MSVPSKKYNLKDGYLTIVTRYMEENIPLHKVICIEVNRKVCTVYIKDIDYFKTYIPFKTLVKQLPSKTFVQVSRSCIVAINEIQEIKGHKIKLSNGKEVIISDNRYKNVIDLYQKKSKNPKCIIEISKTMDVMFLCIDDYFAERGIDYNSLVEKIKQEFEKALKS